MAQDPPLTDIGGTFFDVDESGNSQGDAYTFLAFDGQGSEFGDYPEFTELSQSTDPATAWHDHTQPSSGLPYRNDQSTSLPSQPLPVPSKQVPQHQQPPSLGSTEVLLGPDDESTLQLGSGAAVSNLFEEDDVSDAVEEVRKTLYSVLPCVESLGTLCT